MRCPLAKAANSSGGVRKCGSGSSSHAIPARAFADSPWPRDLAPFLGAAIVAEVGKLGPADVAPYLEKDLAQVRTVEAAAEEAYLARVAGIVLLRQRPSTAKGITFVTLEDETGHANLILWPQVFERQRRLVLGASMLSCRGKLQRESDVIHVVADEVSDLSDLLREVGDRDGLGLPVRDIHGRSGEGVRVRTRDFR